MQYSVFEPLIHRRPFDPNNLNRQNGYDGEPTTNTTKHKRNGM